MSAVERAASWAAMRAHVKATFQPLGKGWSLNEHHAPTDAPAVRLERSVARQERKVTRAPSRRYTSGVMA